ncbi:unnamed protein product [Calypogeia fissa]
MDAHRERELNQTGSWRRVRVAYESTSWASEPRREGREQRPDGMRLLATVGSEKEGRRGPADSDREDGPMLGGWGLGGPGGGPGADHRARVLAPTGRTRYPKCGRIPAASQSVCHCRALCFFPARGQASECPKCVGRGETFVPQWQDATSSLRHHHQSIGARGLQLLPRPYCSRFIRIIY